MADSFCFQIYKNNLAGWALPLPLWTGIPGVVGSGGLNWPPAETEKKNSVSDFFSDTEIVEINFMLVNVKNEILLIELF